jgi:hypothetical protein
MNAIMKKLLLIILGSTSFVASVFADSTAGIHFSNNTKSTIYLVSHYTSGSDNCRGKFSGTKKVSSGDNYSFQIQVKYNNNSCHVELLGYLTPTLNESSQVLKENFKIHGEGGGNDDDAYVDSYITSHDTPPPICGLGMRCSTNLTNSNQSLYLKASNDDNQYAHIVFNNTDSSDYYVNFDHISGDCSDYVDDSWFHVTPGKMKIDYILNTHQGKTCMYNVNVATDSKGKNLLCTAKLGIGDDSKDNTVISSTDGNCSTILSNKNWLANITPVVQ